MLRTVLLTFLIGCCGLQAAHAQDVTTWGGTAAQADREILQNLVVKLEETANSNAYSGALRSRARAEAELLRARLAQGDFQVGDRLTLKVEGQPELTNTFTVTAGPALILPGIREFPLSGILRSEVQSKLADHLKQFLVNPVLEVEALMRIWIAGAVAKPGFYTLPAQTPLTDVLMSAGGPSSQADLEKLEIERDGRKIWSGEALQQAMNEGRTLDQLSLQAGDRVVVNASGGGGGILKILQSAAYIVPPLLFLIDRLRR